MAKQTKQTPNYPKGNIQIQSKNNHWCGLYNGNTNNEHLELDVSKIINNTVATPGMIIMFHGASAPSGWVICDGNNGTPNLREAFIMADTKEDLNKKGSNDTSLITHSHTITFTAVGNHRHTVDPGSALSKTEGEHSHPTEKDSQNKKVGTSCCCKAVSGLNCCKDWLAFSSGPGTKNQSTAAGTHNHAGYPGTRTTVGGEKHTHKVTISETGTKSTAAGGKTLNMPPYYRLVYIMKK